jgi:hypothetical protein
MPVTIAVERLEVANPTTRGPYNGSVTVRVDHPLSPNNPQDGHTSFTLRLLFESAPTYREGLQAAVAQLRAIGDGIVSGADGLWNHPTDEVGWN